MSEKKIEVRCMCRMSIHQDGEKEERTTSPLPSDGASLTFLRLIRRIDFAVTVTGETSLDLTIIGEDELRAIHR